MQGIFIYLFYVYFVNIFSVVLCAALWSIGRNVLCPSARATILTSFMLQKSMLCMFFFRYNITVCDSLHVCTTADYFSTLLLMCVLTFSVFPPQFVDIFTWIFIWNVVFFSSVYSSLLVSHSPAI